jgi:phage-related protein (TIGR01555 family)
MTADGLVNLVSGMGTSRDKAGQASYQVPMLDDATLLRAYKASALVRRAVDLPAEDATREWREWQCKGAEIGKIEALEKSLGLQGKVMQAMKMAGLFGGSAILIGDGGLSPSLPLDPKAIKVGGLKYLTVLSTLDLSAGEIGQDPTKPDFGKPLYWNMRGGTRLHPSRVAVFSGQEPIPAYGIDQHHGWGDSSLMGMLDSLTRVGEAASNASALLYEAKVDVFKIPGLMANLASRGNGYSDEILRRLTLAATGKGISGALVMDADEDYQQKSASLSGISDLMDRFAQLACADAGIPMTLLFEMSPGGMNATGAADIRGYYDRVKVVQALRISPAMAILDECLVRSALGEYPEGLHYNWRSLWQPTAKDKADVGEKMMQALERLSNMAVIPIEAIGKAAVNGLTESGAFPGLEASVADQYGDNGEGEE